MRTVRVQNRHPSRRLDAGLLRRLAHAALAEAPIAGHAKDGCDLGIVITGSAEMARVNQQHLGHEGPTDVITFDYGDPSGARPPGEPSGDLRASPETHRPAVGACLDEGKRRTRLNGEILICLDVAGTQAAAYGTAWPLEVLRYLVHGLLHLCGFDDLAPPARRTMKRHEGRLVKRLEPGFDWDALERPARR